MRSGVVVRKLAAPAAGADWSFVPSTSDRCRLLTVTAELTTDAVVAARGVSLTLTDTSDGVYYQAGLGATQAASLAVRYSWAYGANLIVGTTIADGMPVSAALPRQWLEPGDELSSVTSAIDVADQWSAILVRFVTGEHWRELELWEQLAQQAS